MLKLLASAFVGATAFIGSLFGMHNGNPSEHTASSTPPFGQHMSSSTPGGWGGRMGSSTPGIIGKVSSIDGTTLSVIGRGPGSTATTTYSVDASNAKVMKIGVGTTTVASIKSGDSLLVSGTISGTSVTAKIILDGVMQMRPGTMPMRPMGSSTPMGGRGGPGGGPGMWHNGSTTPQAQS